MKKKKTKKKTRIPRIHDRKITLQKKSEGSRNKNKQLVCDQQQGFHTWNWKIDYSTKQKH